MDNLIHSLKLYETYNLEFILFNAFIACPLWIKNLLESIIEMDEMDIKWCLQKMNKNWVCIFLNIELLKVWKLIETQSYINFTHSI